MSGARKGPVSPRAAVDVARAMGWTLLPLTIDQAATALRTSVEHRDPFDELLLVQAQEEGLSLLTRDARLIDHPCAIGA